MKDEIEKYIDKEGAITFHGMRVMVRCIDYKKSYGKERWLVAPISGTGTSWTEQNPFKPDPIDLDR